MGCKRCGDPRCTGYYLLHPRELYAVEYIKQKNIEACKGRTFKLITSKPDVLYTKFRELHVIAGPHEDMDNLVDVRIPTKEIDAVIAAKEKMLKEVWENVRSKCSSRISNYLENSKK